MTLGFVLIIRRRRCEEDAMQVRVWSRKFITRWRRRSRGSATCRLRFIAVVCEVCKKSDYKSVRCHPERVPSCSVHIPPRPPQLRGGQPWGLHTEHILFRRVDTVCAGECRWGVLWGERGDDDSCDCEEKFVCVVSMLYSIGRLRSLK